MDTSLDTKVDISVYPTHIEVPVIDPVTLMNGQDLREFNSSLTEFAMDFKAKKWIPLKQYTIYDEATKRLSIPRYYLKYLVDYVQYYSGVVDVQYKDVSSGRKVSLPIHPDWHPRDYQVPAIDFLVHNDKSIRALPLNVGEGKAQPLTAKVLTPTGWTCMGDIHVGDTVSTPDGGSSTVLGVYPQGSRPVYKVVFEDGRSTEADEDHLWYVIDPRKYNIHKDGQHVFTTAELEEMLKTKTVNALYVPLIDHSGDTDIALPNDPYIVGNNLSADDELDEIYCHASAEQKRQLIRGLLDHRGRIPRGRRPHTLIYATNHITTAEKIQYIIRSIGGICEIQSKQKGRSIFFKSLTHAQKYYQCYIRHWDPSAITTDVKKQEVLHGTEQMLRIADIRYIGKKITQCILLDSNEHLYITDDYIVTHNTAITVFALSQIGRVPMIVLNGLIDQWYEVMVVGRNGRPPMYTIDPSLVYVIKGQDSILQLLESKDYHPSVILASISTIRNYISRDAYPYCTFPPFEKFVQKLGIGIKVHDECHQCFSTILEIDLRANIKHNIYLSATLTRGDRQSKKIFSKVFPQICQYDVGEIQGHIRTYYLPYNIGPIREFAVTNVRYGYNHNRYEQVILQDVYKKIAFTEFINNCVVAYYIHERKPGQRCIVMASTVEMCKTLWEYLSEMHPDCIVSLYLGGSDDSVLHTADIIVSTVKKGGTGTDISNLKTMINTISIGSEVLVRQIPGRLRRLPDGDTPIYVAMYNLAVDAQIRHYRYCRKFYRKYSKEYFDLSDAIT